MAEKIAPQPMVVFEAINETLKELYVGISDLPLTADQIEARHQENPPAAIAHWQKEHRIWYRCVDGSLASPDSPSFVRAYNDRISRPEWRALAG